MNGRKAKALRKLAYERASITGRKYIWETQENNKGRSATNIVNKPGTMKAVLNILKKM